MTSSRDRGAARWVVVLVVALAVVVAAGVFVVVAIAGAGATAPVDLEVGDCFSFDADGEVAVDTLRNVDTVPCDQPHLAEVLAVGELNPDGATRYPDDDELFRLVDERCADWTARLGSDFGVLPLAPDESTWNSYAGRFQCLAVPFGGEQVTGTVM